VIHAERGESPAGVNEESRAGGLDSRRRCCCRRRFRRGGGVHEHSVAVTGVGACCLLAASPRR